MYYIILYYIMNCFTFLAFVLKIFIYYLQNREIKNKRNPTSLNQKTRYRRHERLLNLIHTDTFVCNKLMFCTRVS